MRGVLRVGESAILAESTSGFGSADTVAHLAREPCPSCPTSRSTAKRSTRAFAARMLQRVRIVNPFVLRTAVPPIADGRGQARP